MVSHTENGGDIGELSDEEDTKRCCECCRPKRKPKPEEIDRYRKQSVAMARERLLSVSEPRDPEEKADIDSKYLPLTFIPDFIISEIHNDSFRSIPYSIPSNVVLLMADVCGFTSLCESYCEKGVSGIEELALVLNGFMSTLTAMLISGGGDILNFAGDAFLVQWVEDSKLKTVKMAVKKAYECAVSLQTHQCLQTKNLNGTLKIKIGIAMGEISTWVLGSPSEFLLFVVAGSTLPKVHEAEEKCFAGEITVTKEVYDILKELKLNTYNTTEMEDGFVKITGYTSPPSKEEPFPYRIELFEICNQEHINMAKVFLIPGLRDIKSTNELQYVSELTMVTILFIALLNVEVAEPKVLDRSFDIILDTCKKYGGVLNKMLLFDKGCTFLVAYGLPGLKHSNDAARGIYCSLDIVSTLKSIGIKVSVGISSGTCFCGLVGHPQRQEYTVIGTHVNLAARIMVVYDDEPVALNVTTYHLSRDELGLQSFIELPARKLKGIDNAGAIYALRELVGKHISKTTFETVEDSNIHGSEREKAKIRLSVAALCDEEKRSSILKTLLPVLLVEGQFGSGKSYMMFFAVDAAIAMNYKPIVCCTTPSNMDEPFHVISRLLQNMLGITMDEGCLEREKILLSALPITDYSTLYLLNHLFHVKFPVPAQIASDALIRDEQFKQLAKIMFQEFCKDDYSVIAVDNADFIDEQSWHFILQLAEEEKVLILLSLTLDFQENNTSASYLLFKAYMHINTEASQEDYFAPLLCWFLGVQAVHTQLFLYLKEITEGKVQLLKEISLSKSIYPLLNFIPLDSLDERRIKKEFFVDKLLFFNDDKPLACEFKPEADLRHASIPRNINDAVKESFNTLTLQDRMLLKRASVLGLDFDLHTLESISPGLKRTEVLESINNLISNHIISSVCTLDNTAETVHGKAPRVVIETRNKCFCFSVYCHINQKIMKSSGWAVGPYHRLKFRTHDFRSCILAFMTKDQLYSMHMEVADNLEVSGPECASCRSTRIERTENTSALNLRSYSISCEKCACLDKRPKLYSEISALYSSVGMIFLPIYYKKKAAQASNNVDYPIQALHYVHLAQKMMPLDDSLADEDIPHEESYFDPLVLKVQLNKTKAESYLLLEDTYSAAFFAFQSLEMLGMDAICFHGVFNPQEFENILPHFESLHAEFITKLISVIAKTYLQLHRYKTAQDMLRIENVALKLYPIDFLQVLNHMTAMYVCKYWMHQEKNRLELENNIFKLCYEKLRNFEMVLELTELRGIGLAYIAITEINLSLGNFKKSESSVNEAVRILQLVNDVMSLPKLKVILCQVHYHTVNYDKCGKVLLDLSTMPASSDYRIYNVLYICSLMMLLMKDSKIMKDSAYFHVKCDHFTMSWSQRSVQLLPKDLKFFVAVCVTCCSNLNVMDKIHVCVRERKRSLHMRSQTTSKKSQKYLFEERYKIATTLYKKLDKNIHNYWMITGIILLWQVKLRGLKGEFSFTENAEDAISFLEELIYMKHVIKTNYPLYLKIYRKMVTDAEKMNLKK